MGSIDREKILELLDRERVGEKDEKFEKISAVLEKKRVEENYGALKLFIYSGGRGERRLEYRIVFLFEIDPGHPDWKELEVGDSRYTAIAFDARAKDIVEKVKGFILRSIEEGKIQDFIR